MSAKNEQELVLQKESGVSEEEKDGGCENERVCECRMKWMVESSAKERTREKRRGAVAERGDKRRTKTGLKASR